MSGFSDPERGLRRPRLSFRLALGAGIGTAAALLVLLLRNVAFLGDIESLTLDLRQRLFAAPGPGAERVALVVIDDASIEGVLEEEKLAFPWPRDFYEPIILFLKRAGARAIVFDLLFLDPWSSVQAGDAESDRILAAAAKEAGNVVAAGRLLDAAGGRDSTPAQGPPPVSALVPLEEAGGMLRGPERGFRPPYPELAAAVRSIGFADVEQDRDNTVRRLRLVAHVPGGVAGSLALQAVRVAERTDGPCRFDGRTLEVAGRRVPVDAEGRMLVRFYGQELSLPAAGALAVLRSYLAQEEGKPLSVDPRMFRDKVVFVGVHASGLEDIVTAPVSARFPGVEFHATACADILGGHFLAPIPPAGAALIILALSIAGGVCALAFWRALPAFVGLFVLYALYAAAAAAAFRGGAAVELFFPGVALGAAYGFAFVAAWQFEGRWRRRLALALHQYLAPEVVAELLSHPEKLRLGGERRRIVIYFSDLEGFSRYAADAEPERVVSFLNRYLSAMTEPILETRGVVDKFQGDGIMAFWGAPAPLEADTRRALQAVAGQLAMLAELNRGLRREGFPQVRFRAGLHFGEAVVGNMGSERRFAYTAVGDAVNLASRLEGANKFFGSSVLVTDAVREEAGAGFLMRSLGRLVVPGRSEPCYALEFLGLEEEADGIQKERLARYHEAFQALEEGRLAEAEDGFAFLAEEARDSVALRFLELARRLRREGSGWDGLWIVAEK